MEWMAASASPSSLKARLARCFTCIGQAARIDDRKNRREWAMMLMRCVAWRSVRLVRMFRVRMRLHASAMLVMIVRMP